MRERQKNAREWGKRGQLPNWNLGSNLLQWSLSSRSSEEPQSSAAVGPLQWGEAGLGRALTQLWWRDKALSPAMCTRPLGLGPVRSAQQMLETLGHPAGHSQVSQAAGHEEAKGLAMYLKLFWLPSFLCIHFMMRKINTENTIMWPLILQFVVLKFTISLKALTIDWKSIQKIKTIEPKAIS